MNRSKKTFVQFLDDYPVEYCLRPADFFNIIHFANIDYSKNQYSEAYCDTSTDKTIIWTATPIHRKHRPSPINTEGFGKYSGDGETRVPLGVEGIRGNSRERSSEFGSFTPRSFHSPPLSVIPPNFTLPEKFTFSDTHTLGKDLRTDKKDSRADTNNPNKDTITACKLSIPDNPITSTSTTIHEINDPINTIADMIAIIDKYDVLLRYNIDVKLLSNIRKELVDLNGMIGMETLKQSVFNQLVYFIQGFHLGEEAGDQMRGDFKHTVIYGPPGTGKTEVAKIIGRMYANLGVLKKGVFKKVTRNDLVAGYLGQTAIKTKNAITDCLGGVLFIDEAYSLSNSNDLDSFSKECLDTLCESLSDHKADLMVIIAGYEEDLEQHFFTANRGLDSRFVWRFKIDSYTSVELAGIFQKKIRESGWKTESDTVIEPKWFEQHKETFRHFGRDMEMLFLYTKISHSRRVFGKPTEIHRTLTKPDIEKGYELFLKNAKPIKENMTRKIFESMYV